MRPTSAKAFAFRSWTTTLLTGLLFVGLAYGLRYEVEGADTTFNSDLDLTLLLGSYLFLFCLRPIQKAVQRKCRRQHDYGISRAQAEHTASHQHRAAPANVRTRQSQDAP